MRRLLPSRVEVMIFAALALVCAAIVGLFHPNTSDLGFAALAGPVFLIAAVAHPGVGISQILQSPDGIGYLVAVARALGAATLVCSVAVAARDAVAG